MVDLRLEAHVEHPVRLVEDQDPHAVQTDQAALGDVLEASRRRDEDVRARRTLRLLAELRAAVGDADAQALGPRDVLEVVGDLLRELAGWDEDQRRRRRAAPVEPLDDRQRERERLARARLRASEDVLALERVGHHEALDLERREDPARREGVDDGIRYAEVQE
jgi:hypothetical protein